MSKSLNVIAIAVIAGLVGAPASFAQSSGGGGSAGGGAAGGAAGSRSPLARRRLDRRAPGPLVLAASRSDPVALGATTIRSTILAAQVTVYERLRRRARIPQGQRIRPDRRPEPRVLAHCDPTELGCLPRARATRR
jgi:hypothetical protein